MTGILDIGSNTIRLVVYENGEKIKERSFRSDIINNTDNNILSEIGIDNLCDYINLLVSDSEAEEILASGEIQVNETVNAQGGVDANFSFNMKDFGW